MDREVIENEFARRYATPAMREIWSPRGKVIAERRLWVLILEQQQRLGLVVPDGTVEAYAKVVDQVDLESIDQRERKTNHDVKARIEEFNALAGGLGSIHLGMTSRDLTENVEQMQIRQSLVLIRDKYVAVLSSLAQLARDHKLLVMVGRSHNVPAQVTTLGKRFATIAEELLFHFEQYEHFLRAYPLRGIKGPMGTVQDQLELLGSIENVLDLESAVQRELGFGQILDSVGQIYPRSLDLALLNRLTELVSAPSNLAYLLRSMAGTGQVSEPGNATGSTAMPHKINPRLSERVCGLVDCLHGLQSTISRLAGKQMLEGDVSCSTVRRLALPDAFYATDGLIESFLTILLGLTVYPEMIELELERNMPFLATTKILATFIKRGVKREVAHEIIGQSSKQVVQSTYRGGQADELYRLIGEDNRSPLNQAEIRQLVGQPIDFIGDSEGQVMRVTANVQVVTRRYPEAAIYTPGSVL